MKLHHRILSSLLYGLIRLSGHLPIEILYFKAAILQFIAEKILRYRYQVIIQNLSRSFPEKNYQEIRKLAHGFYKHFFELFAEVIKSQGMRPAKALIRYKIENHELISDYHARGINVIVLGGHWGNWEWLIMTPLYFNFSNYTLYKPLSSNIMESLMGKIRKRFGLKLLPMNQAARFILSKKDFPALYFFIGDQSPSHRDAEYSVDFLNQPSLMFAGGAKLAKATSSAVVYQSISKTERGYYSVKFHPLSQPGDEMNEREILQKFAGLLEADIKNKPAYWLWSHKRWKHKATSK
ncbi:MAG: lysophospholipid acyltransferase family protein [Lentimicrobium sp.]|nr:lysophospholipid acyltransferase family protein [Lentimicrobium sp.]